MRIKLVALILSLGLGHLHACTGDNEQTEAVQEESVVENTIDEITPESQEVADAELTNPGETESPVREADDARSPSDDSTFAETDESMAMYSEPPLPGDDADAESSASATNEDESKSDETTTPTVEVTSKLEGATNEVSDTSNQAKLAEDSSSSVSDGVNVQSDAKPVISQVVKKPSDATSQPTEVIEKIGTYTVRPGDTLGKIAIKLYRKFNRYKDLADENGLSPPYLLYPGQTIRYGGSVGVARNETPDKSLVVQSGDTLWHLAEKHLGSPYVWQAFVTWNQGVLSDPNKIAPGMKLVYGSVPQTGTSASIPVSTKANSSDVANGAESAQQQAGPSKSKMTATTQNDQKSAKLNPSASPTKPATPVRPGTVSEVNEAKKAAFDELAEPPEVPENSFEEEEAE